MKEKQQKQLRALSNMNAYHDYTFSAFYLHVEGVQDAYKAACDTNLHSNVQQL